MRSAIVEHLLSASKVSLSRRQQTAHPIVGGRDHFFTPAEGFASAFGITE
jgi:hypothetical protein